MRNIIIIFLLVILFSCKDEQKYFKLSGTLKNSNNSILYLSEFKINNFTKIDSVFIDNSGKFKFKRKAKTANYYQLSVSNDNYITLIIKPKDDIYIEADIKNLSHNYYVNGSEDSKQIKELNDKLNNALLQVDSLGRIYEQSLGTKNFTETKQRLDNSYDSLKNITRTYAIGFIERNLRSLASIMALYSEFTPRDNLFDAKNDFSYFQLVDSILYPLYPNIDITAALHNHVNQIKETLKLEKAINSKLGIGAIPPDIALPDKSGQIIKLSSIKNNKYILIDFWASWCSPCRKQNPNLVKVYNKYHNKGFEIYGVSLDKNLDTWIKAIEDDKLPWINVSDLKYWNSVVVSLYNIQAIPSNFLLNSEGKIIAKNLSVEELNSKLNELFD